MSVKLENGHIVRQLDHRLKTGTVRFVRDGVARVLWDTGPPDTDVQCSRLEVHVHEGRRLVWKQGK